jgi:hypothetical protein
MPAVATPETLRKVLLENFDDTVYLLNNPWITGDMS